MRRDRKSKAKRERMIMIASSALVMGALTLTGVYMKENTGETAEEDYTVDLSGLDEGTVQDFTEIDLSELNGNDTEAEMADTEFAENSVTEDDLDYDPLAAGSHIIEIPGLTEGVTEELMLKEQEEIKKNRNDREDEDEEDRGEDSDEKEDREEGDGEEMRDTAAEAEVLNPSFSEEQGLTRPVSGEILMYYSMDKSIYFATLDQFKYHPAVVFSAAEGESVSVCADAVVSSLYYDDEIGNAVMLDLGNGYHAVCGQLKDIQVSEGDRVKEGSILGYVAAPTKYYTVEGPNLYFQLKKDGASVNPEEMFR